MDNLFTQVLADFARPGYPNIPGFIGANPTRAKTYRALNSLSAGTEDTKTAGYLEELWLNGRGVEIANPDDASAAVIFRYNNGNPTIQSHIASITEEELSLTPSNSYGSQIDPSEVKHVSDDGQQGIKCNGPNCGLIRCAACFTEGTLVSTPTGRLPIDQLVVGDEVIAYDHVRRQPVTRSVTNTVQRKISRVYRVVVAKEVPENMHLVAGTAKGVELQSSKEFAQSNVVPSLEPFTNSYHQLTVMNRVRTVFDTLFASAEHPFFVPELGKYLRADKLRRGLQLLGLVGSLLTVHEVSAIPVPSDVYNISVSEAANYFVGEEGVLVHNSSSCDLAWGHINVTNESPAEIRQVLVEVLGDDPMGELRVAFRQDLKAAVTNGNSSFLDFFRGAGGAALSGVELRKRVGAFRELLEYSDFRRNPDILQSYLVVPRVNPGNVDFYLEMRISDLTSTHPVPRPNSDFTIPEWKQKLQTEGFILDPDGRSGINVVQLPDGTNLLLNGNHKLQAMRELNQIIVPTNHFTFDQGNTVFGSITVAKFAEVSRLTGFYDGPPIPHSDPDYITALAIIWLDDMFGDTWR